ncbi:MAG: molybdopterin-guanine dinucleotide biosynthesis protein B [Deltaproteobacteria bacterium]|nr:molybdopterin-guanine dinucleotide biosynthesis protein B [Deltaproteobacteria bacterium]
MNSIPIVSFVGTSGSGKTTLLEKVIKHLVKKGYRVGTIKHDAHTFEIDHEGKDSFRHKKAGAKTVVLSSPEKVAVIKDVDKEMTIDSLKFNFLSDNLDIVITEGYKKAANHKIEVIRKELSKESVCKGDKNLIAYASSVKLRTKLPCFDIDNAKSIASFIERKLLKNSRIDNNIQLMVNSKNIPLKPFIADLIIQAIMGMTMSLKGCKDAEEIDIRIRRR